MKKMTVRISERLLHCFCECSAIYERVEILSLHNMGADVQTKVCRFRLHEGMTIERVRHWLVRDITILQHEGRDYTCIMKGKMPEEINRFIRQYDLKPEYPIIIENGTCTLSLIGSPDELHTIVNAAKEKGWALEVIAVTDYNPHVSGVLTILTGKQREILTGAYRNGYFDHPRKIDAGKLAEKMGMHKTTLLEHVHKAEKRLIGHILEQAG